MNSFFPFIRAPLIALFLFSTIAFALGFGLAYQQDRIRADDTGRMAWSHLWYAEELKDDMAVIDWSHDMDKLGGLRAFQASLNSKIIAEGGNRELLPGPSPEGISYLFPSNWVYRLTSAGDPQGTGQFILVYHLGPGPLLWGLFSFSTVLLTGFVMMSLGKNFHATPSKFSTSSPLPAKNRSMSAPIQTTRFEIPKEEKPFLFIDKNHFIRQATAQAAMLLGKNLDALNNGHLLDLSPDPAFIRAIEKAEETKLLRPFPGHPHISVFLKPDPYGCQVFFESQEESETP